MSEIAKDKLESLFSNNMLEIKRSKKKFDEYLDKVLAAKNAFFETGVIDPIVRKEVSQSWIRTREYGKDPEKQPLSEALYKIPEDDYRQIKEKNNTLISVTGKIVESVCKSLKQLNFIIWLCDADCNLIYLNNRQYLIKSADKLLNFSEGYCYDEKYMGTNSAHLSLYTNSNVIVSGPEHYDMISNDVSCASALIHGTNGTVIGTLSVTFFTELYFDNRIIAGMLLIASDLIEKELQKLNSNRILKYTLNNVAESIIILDHNLNVSSVNESFMNLVQMNEEEITKLNMRHVFREIDFEKWHAGNAEPLSLNEMILYIGSKKLRVKTNVYFSYNTNLPGEAVIICQKITDIIQLSHKYTKNNSSFTFSDIITQDKNMLQLIKNCTRVSSLNHTILIEGPSGTGKELLAHSIHSASTRSDKPFIAVNCAALPINLIESELFGYEKGSFSGALPQGKVGKFELAQGGTLFLDEIGELPLDIQAKLLRVLDNSKVMRIGGNIEIDLDVRIIAATNRNLYEETQLKHFREDLYYRLNVINFKLPSLNERSNDIPLLVNYFINRLNERNSGVYKTIDDESMKLLTHKKWRGNIRELQNSITRAYYLCESEIISQEHFQYDSVINNNTGIQNNNFIVSGIHKSVNTSQSELNSSAEADDTKNKGYHLNLGEEEKMKIVNALKETKGNVAAAAVLVQMSRATLYRKIKQYMIIIK